MVTEDYVSFETAKFLKDKGFDEPVNCFYFVDGTFSNNTFRTKNSYTRHYAAPTLQMAMKWLREVHKIFIEVGYNRFYGTYNVHVFNMVEQQDDPYKLPARFNNYEEACDTAIKYCLENLI